jgi:hypothetical protein
MGFIPDTFDCFEDSTLNFFHSANYGNSSFTAAWATRTTPYVETFGTPVYQLVFNKFDIPMDFSNGTPPGGHLPGMDIKRMPAIEAARLSLAEPLVNGEWWDVNEDGLGGVYFQKVFGDTIPAPLSLDIRLCLPAVSKTNLMDMVIVSGYDAPPTVEVKAFQDVVPLGLGTINPEVVTGQEDLFTVSPKELLSTTNHKNLAANTVYKSYPDPVIVEGFGGQEQDPFYDLQAFEKILGYVVDIDGMPDDPAEASRVSYSFSDTTPWYQKITFPQFSETTDFDGLPITYYQSTTSAESPLYTDRYGSPWPLYNKPVDIVFTGNKIVDVTQVPIPSLQAFYWVTIKAQPEFVTMPGGSSWNWTRPDVNSYDFEVYFQPDQIWVDALPLMTDAGGLYRVQYQTDETAVGEGNFSAWQPNLIGIAGGLGYAAYDMYIGWELDRPCVIVTDADGDAESFANTLNIRYAPIVETDTPAPEAYKHSEAGSKILDQSRTLLDTDPTTCQNFEESDREIMEELAQGNVVRTSLPFCEDGEACLKVAETIFDYMNYEGVTTYTLTCGPDSNPKLGATVEGFSSNLRIDSINYNFQDGSSYTIEVTLAPVFASIGSWSINSTVRQTEEVTRPAIVTWSAGDGTNYRVDVKGLGSFYAVNGVQGANRIYYQGDTVTVTLYNVPKEA